MSLAKLIACLGLVFSVACDRSASESVGKDIFTDDESDLTPTRDGCGIARYVGTNVP